MFVLIGNIINFVANLIDNIGNRRFGAFFFPKPLSSGPRNSGSDCQPVARTHPADCSPGGNAGSESVDIDYPG